LPQDGAPQPRPERGGGRQAEPGAHRHPEDADVRGAGEAQGRERGDGIQPVPGHPGCDGLDALVGDELLVGRRCHRRRHAVAVVRAVDRDDGDSCRDEPGCHPQVAFAALVAAAAVEEQRRSARLRALRRPQHAGHRHTGAAHDKRTLGAACADLFSAPLDTAAESGTRPPLVLYAYPHEETAAVSQRIY
jgi:hypothetical protein